MNRLTERKTNYPSCDKEGNLAQVDYIEIKDKKLVLILGNESHGINQDLINLLDYKVYIPIKFESLNVAIACGILLSKYLK